MYIIGMMVLSLDDVCGFNFTKQHAFCSSIMEFFVFSLRKEGGGGRRRGMV
jgi:hypothetical protein